MLNDLEDILGDGRKKAKRTHYPRRTLGPLHELLNRALPDLCDTSGVCNLHSLAEELGLTYAAVMKWVRPGVRNRIPARRVDTIVQLSADQKTGGNGFKPATKADFLPFLF